jgi:cytochrome c oxidase subunit 2
MQSMAAIVRRLPARVALTFLAALAIGALVGACGSGTASVRGSSHGISLVARGKQLYVSQGCEDCHSLNGTPGPGPTWKGLYGSRVHLTTGRIVVANAAYLTKHIVDPNAMTVSGFPGSVMSEAILSDDLAQRPAAVRSLVAFIESLK